MSINRLSDLRRRSGEQLIPKDVKTSPSTEGDSDRVNFLNQLDVIRNKFNEIDALSAQISSIALRAETSTVSAEFRAVHTEFSDHIHRSSQLIKLIKSQIDALQVSNNDFEAKYAEGRESEVNMRRASWAGFSNLLRASLVTFNQAQSQFDEVYHRRTSACGFNADLTPSPDASPVAGVGQAFLQANAETEAIRKEDMLRLEKSLAEIREAFLQIATLVESQGEMLECIEFSTVNAKNYAHQANIELIKARKKQRQRLWIYVCIFVIFLIIVVAVATNVPEEVRKWVWIGGGAALAVFAVVALIVR